MDSEEKNVEGKLEGDHTHKQSNSKVSVMAKVHLLFHEAYNCIHLAKTTTHSVDVEDVWNGLLKLIVF